jgi:hypothetical protein
MHRYVMSNTEKHWLFVVGVAFDSLVMLECAVSKRVAHGLPVIYSARLFNLCITSRILLARTMCHLHHSLQRLMLSTGEFDGGNSDFDMKLNHISPSTYP